MSVGYAIKHSLEVMGCRDISVVMGNNSRSRRAEAGGLAQVVILARLNVMEMNRAQGEASKGDDVSDGEDSELSVSESLLDNENSVGGSIQTAQIINPVETIVSGQTLNVIRTYNSVPLSNPTILTLASSQQSQGSSMESTPDFDYSPSTGNSISLGLRNLPKGLVDWSNLRIQQDTPQTRDAPQNLLVSTSKPGYLSSLTKETVEKYRNLYFSQFHDRWPIVHSPSYDENEEASELLLPSILMIGGWVDGTTTSKEWALEVHHNLVEHILPRLCQPNGIDTMTQSLPIVLYQCTLLNIIFGSYCGKRDILAKGLVLRNLLAASIYEVGILTPGTIYPDDKPGFFLPFHLVKKQQRQRIAVDLFKIDTYFSVIKGNHHCSDQKSYTLVFQTRLHIGMRMAFQFLRFVSRMSRNLEISVQ
ncbi:hypothetical protein EYC84_008156 [Monilinia fructicola]|uniref:Xylanolytic transcriptional activator regulatory domain-containing protein n=1 Tax=Monilinia fructicola TaxID=38448 RepID=A0A5M9JH70_MONFR|nr:hypothetical protein EYC84_008156 [Monilinia fructicola]